MNVTALLILTSSMSDGVVCLQQQVSISSGVNMSGAALGLGYVGVETVSRLNPRAPDFAQRHPLMQQKHNAQVL